MVSKSEPDMAPSNNVITCLGGEDTAMESRPIPTPRAGELLLKLRCVGFCGTDLFKLTTNSVKPGMVLGHEIVGEVAAIGEGVNQFALGDRVAVPHHVPCGSCRLCLSDNETMCEIFRDNLMEPGGFADHVLIRDRATAQAAHKVPDTVSDEAAVFMEPAACVLRGVNRSGIGPEGTAAVMGGGSMGLLHLLVIKAVYPYAKVLLIDPVVDRSTLATELGADKTAAPGDDALAAAAAMTDGYGVDAVFDTVGGASLLEAGLALSRQGGSVILFAHAPHGQCANFDLNDLFKYERRVLGTYSGALGEQAAVLALITSGRFNPAPLVSHTMPLDDFARGYGLAKERKALKILFTPSLAASSL